MRMCDVRYVCMFMFAGVRVCLCTFGFSTWEDARPFFQIGWCFLV